MSVIIDFNGYFITASNFVAKEFGVMSVTEDSSGTVIDEKGVFKPFCNWNDLPDELQSFYSLVINKLNGIPWESGNISSFDQESIFRNYLKNAKVIIVPNELKKKLLIQIIGNFKKILCMTDVHYDDIEKLGTNCSNHNNPSENNCAYDNVARIKHFLEKTGMAHMLNFELRGDVREEHRSFVNFLVEETFKNN
ncbi:uncharacterized protein LOC130665693 [Microplitis mediator]|uniref:uncharacterized protein LOC130665693 n=1 Tax=Microplitis mediator TaxID=375433 RepID=UPI002555BA13|nr:uncharacterized protein LOC130665693 [Microplitis mediator]